MIQEKPDIVGKSFRFGIQIVKFVVSCDNRKIYRLLDQLIASGTSIGANIEEAQSASSKKDFINKMTIALREAKEARYWLRIFHTCDLDNKSKLEKLMEESLELIKIITAIVKKSKSNS